MSSILFTILYVFMMYSKIFPGSCCEREYHLIVEPIRSIALSHVEITVQRWHAHCGDDREQRGKVKHVDSRSRFGAVQGAKM